VDNAAIADRLDAFASLLELAEANPYTIRAYRRAAELIRGTAAPVDKLVRTGRVKELRGIGPGIEARLRELLETGQIAELAELERDLAPGLVGLGRYLGLTAKRSVEIARALGVRTPEELRAAAAAGRLRAVPGVGPKLELQILQALAREGEPRPPRGIHLPRARELVGQIAEALGGEPAGDPRRWRDACERLAVVCAAPEPAPLLARFEELPQIVAVIERRERRAVGVTVEGVPVELVVAEPARAGTELLRATGAEAYVAALEPLPDAVTEPEVYAALGIPCCPPELDWVQASVHGGQRMPGPEMTRRVEEALRNPHVSCLSHPTGRLIGRRPENAVDLERVYELARAHGVAVEVNGLPDRLDLRGEHVRDAIAAGVKIVCSTDAHGPERLAYMELAVHTARRGGATAADVINAWPLGADRRRRLPTNF
jgi:DNA polymerase/3'-5' exonuclease PolX